MTASRSTLPRRSLVRRFNLALALLYLLCVVLAIPAIYVGTERQLTAQAERELKLLVDMVQSIEGYVGDHLRPFLMARGLLHSPGFSGIVATALIAEKLSALQPGYYIKNVSDNPLNPRNRPQPFEEELLVRFRNDRRIEGLRETRLIDNRKMLVAAAPKASTKACLHCHGDPATAPEAIRSQWGETTGYYYKSDEVVGVSLIGVPLADARPVVLERSLIAIGALTALFTVLFLSVNILLRRTLVSPILQITDAARESSLGRMDRPLDLGRNDEVGDLAHAVELLRRSFDQVMKRFSVR